MADISITTLHDPVSIVHIPVGSAPTAATRIYWTLDRAVAEGSEFVNLTSNRIEIALFAPADLVSDEWPAGALEPGVAVNGPWRVFEVASGDDGGGGGNYDSPHLRCVSAPLAQAGISILYQSSYFTDFLLVKSTDFERASAIFSAKGWNCDSVLPPSTRRRSVVSSDLTTSLLPSPLPLSPPIPSAATFSTPSTPPVPEITVLASPLACIGLSPDVESSLSERLRKLLVWPERAVLAIEHARGRRADYAADAYERRHSTTEGQEMKREGSMEARASSRARGRPRPFISYTRTEDGVSVLTEVRVLRAMLSRGERADLGAPELDGSDSEWSEGEELFPTTGTPEEAPELVSSPGLTSTPAFASTPALALMPAFASTPTEVDERGRQAEAGGGEGGGEPKVSSPSGHSLRGRDSIPINWASPPSTPASARFSITSLGGFTPIVRSSSGSGSGGGSTERRRHSENSAGASERGRSRPPQAAKEDYFNHSPARDHSVSRQSTSSRMSSSSRLSSMAGATQAPGHSRTRSDSIMMGVLQRGGLGFVDPRVRRASEGVSREPWLARPHHTEPCSTSVMEQSSSEDEGEDEDEEGAEDPRARMMRCLQLDLRAVGHGYHLDKSGLVTRFSDVLHRGGVRMLYSSTTHTANILVEGRDVVRAERALRD